jgi:DNA transformation protein
MVLPIEYSRSCVGKRPCSKRFWSCSRESTTLKGMPVSDEYLTYVIDQLECLGPVQARRMFGGAGLYFEGLFFAIVADDVLYFKVDDSNRGDYEAADMGPFKPFADKDAVMQYYEVPIDVLENRNTLRDWAGKAVSVAERKADK